MSLRKALLAATLLSLPMTVNAQGWDARVQGVYVGAGFGANYLMGNDESSVYRYENGTTDGFRTSTEWGYAGVLSVGYGFGNGLRLELEGNFRQNDMSDGRYVAGTTGNSNEDYTRNGGTVRSYGVMVNALYDFNLGAVAPYVGAGAGYVWHEYDSARLSGSSFGGQDVIDGNEGSFAYQAIVGVALPIASVPGLALTAEYRFMGTLGHEITSTYVVDGAVQDRGTYDVDNFNHSIMFGVRYNFGRTAAPAPVAAAAPAPARTFLVFFDWNRADLTARARQIIGEAAQARTRQPVTRIEVNGHTDTSGSAGYNQGLSERRAAAVAAELVRLGVPRGEIVTRGFGQSQLLVATPNNVREPQNRRVEIVLR